MIGFEPSDEQQLVVETVRQFAENEIRPGARGWNESRQLPASLLAHAHALGLVSSGVAEAHDHRPQRGAGDDVLFA